MSSAATHILVTGANQGVGHGIVKQLLAEVENVVVYSAARSQTKADEAVKIFKESPKKHPLNHAKPIVIDLTKDETIAKAAEEVSTLDVLVNNASVSNLSELTFSSVDGDLQSLQAQRNMFHSVFDTNVFGTVALINAFLPHLLNVSSGAGSIGRFAARSTVQPTPTGKPMHYYASSKTTLNVFTLFYSKLEPEIRVLSVSPGFTKTALNNFTGTESVETGARYVTDLILDRDHPTGVFVSSGKEIEW